MVVALRERGVLAAVTHEHSHYPDAHHRHKHKAIHSPGLNFDRRLDSKRCWVTEALESVGRSVAIDPYQPPDP